MHTEYFECYAISAVNCIGDTLYVLVMLALCVLDHRVDGGELLGAFGAAKVFGLLVMVQDDFVLEAFFAVEAKGTQARHVSLFSAHLL